MAVLDANVSALVWDLNTKKNTYNLAGDFKYSFINDKQKGISSQLNLQRPQENIDIVELEITKDYDNNDLGIN
jgi:hypothetical protein